MTCLEVQMGRINRGIQENHCKYAIYQSNLPYICKDNHKCGIGFHRAPCPNIRNPCPKLMSKEDVAKLPFRPKPTSHQSHTKVLQAISSYFGTT